MSKHVGEKCGKRADGDPDGHHHTILLHIWIFLPIDYIESPRADTQSYQPAFISARGLL